MRWFAYVKKWGKNEEDFNFIGVEMCAFSSFAFDIHKLEMSKSTEIKLIGKEYFAEYFCESKRNTLCI